MEKKRVSVRYYGSVQGVGFRYTACHAARMLGLTGWVENCSDGTVLAEIQGTAEEIDKMEQLIGSGRYIEITHRDMRNIPVVDDERSFEIRGY